MTGVDARIRRARLEDALRAGVLATQVFLDTYATEGIRQDIASEVLGGYSPEALARRIADPRREFHLAEQGDALIGFVDLLIDAPCPIPVDAPSSEMARLYVQRPFQRQGIGAMLLRHAESVATAARSRTLWLTAWAGNGQALSFYRAMGYHDAGRVEHVIEGRPYENRVFVKTLP